MILVEHICLLLSIFICYLQGTLAHGLHLRLSSIDRLVSYIDVDLAGCPKTRRFTSRFCVYIGDNFVSWSSKREHVVSRSGAEAEYKWDSPMLLMLLLKQFGFKIFFLSCIVPLLLPSLSFAITLVPFIYMYR